MSKSPADPPAVVLALTLDDIANLFQPPVLDPFRGQSETESGVERLVQELSAQHVRRGQRLRLTLRIPARQITPDLATRTSKALQSYCLAQFGKTDREQAVLRRQGRFAFRIGLIFLAVCLVISSLVEQSSAVPELLRRLLSESALIIGWVAMWRPIDSLLFDGWMFARDRRVYACLHDVDVTLEPAEVAPG